MLCESNLEVYHFTLTVFSVLVINLFRSVNLLSQMQALCVADDKAKPDKASKANQEDLGDHVDVSAS